MTLIFVFIFGNYNEAHDFPNDFKDKNQPISRIFSKKPKNMSDANTTNTCGNQLHDEWQLMDFKKKRMAQLELRQILKQFSLFVIFLFFLYYVSFMNVRNEINYTKLFINTFVEQKNPNELGLNQVYFIV